MERSPAHATYKRIYAVVRTVSAGRVATYGQIASLAGLNGGARQVGYALHSLTRATAVPWHRVLNAKGEISRRAVHGGELSQRLLLEREGIVFDARGRVNLARFGWRRPVAAGCGMRDAGRGMRKPTSRPMFGSHSFFDFLSYGSEARQDTEA